MFRLRIISLKRLKYGLTQQINMSLGFLQLLPVFSPAALPRRGFTNWR